MCQRFRHLSRRSEEKAEELTQRLRRFCDSRRSLARQRDRRCRLPHPAAGLRKAEEPARLAAPQRSVDAAELEKLVMGPDLDDPALIHDDEPVKDRDRR